MKIGRGKRNLSGLPQCPPDEATKAAFCQGLPRGGPLQDLSLAIAQDPEFGHFAAHHAGAISISSVTLWQIYNEASKALDRIFARGDTVPLTLRRDEVRLVVSASGGNVSISVEYQDSHAQVQNILLGRRED